MSKLVPTVLIKIKMDYLVGRKKGNEVYFPTLKELSEIYDISLNEINKYRKSDTDDWEVMRSEMINRGINIAFRESALKHCKKLEDIYECLFLSLDALYSQGLQDIISGKIKIRNTSDFLSLVKSITDVKEKQSGRDPLSMYDARIRDIWEKLSLDTEEVAEKIANKINKVEDNPIDVDFEEIDNGFSSSKE